MCNMHECIGIGVFLICCRLSQRLMSLGPLDSKCKTECSYCEGKCHHCLQPAGIGYSLKTANREILNFCSVSPCYSFYSCTPASQPVYVEQFSDTPPVTELLLQITKVISTNWSSNTIVVIQLCIGSGAHRDLQKDHLYVLTQFRTATCQAFFDFTISKCFEPLNTLWYIKHQLSTIMHYSDLLT